MRNLVSSNLAALACVLLIAQARAETPPDYERDVKSLLKAHCVICHGQLKQKGGLRLDAGALIFKGGKDGFVVVAGKSSESVLLQRVLSKAEDDRMPPEGKPLTSAEADVLRRWIDSGAHYPKDEVAAKTPAEHWAFQPVRNPPVPAVKNSAWVRNNIDAFVLAKLEQRDWKPSPQAEPIALLRRVYLDLTGLPPGLEEQQNFAKNPTSAALDAIVDDLLSRPTYGERWARHWLDVVRYADSNGYERDAEKPFVWRYRDYVINALNKDLPFDRFTLEQLAGDELPDRSNEAMIATTFLRLGHWDDEPADPTADRYDQLDDIVSTTGQAFMGLTIGCARCHDHKFEPLSSRDYYSLLAVFNPLQRPANGRTELSVPLGTREQLAVQTARNAEIAKLEKDKSEAAKQRIKELRAAAPDLPEAYIWNEPSPKPPETHVLVRGSPSRLGDAVQPAVPAVLVKQQPPFPSRSERTTQRRLGLAQWLASGENPLTARVIVNRIWQQHFGHGLVRTANDFGLMGDAPSHPELLDWLSYWFVHDANWSLKKLHRLILTSNAWRMSKASNAPYAAADPENRLLWRMPIRRLEVEALRDSMLAVSGQLNPKRFGPAMKPRIQEAALEANTDKQSIWKPSDEKEASRRTIYAFVKRGLVVPMLEVLDLADTVCSCPQRQVTTVAPQALSLFNGGFVNQQSRHFATRLMKEAGDDAQSQIQLAWRLALCREPSASELAKMTEFLQQECERLKADALKTKKDLNEADARRAALDQACRVILNLNEFAYPE